jgi:CHAD domain-containing protein
MRSLLQLVDGAIALPKAAQRKRLRGIAQTLGTVRDLDVLMAILKDHYRPLLPKAEKKGLDKVLSALGRSRQRSFTQLKKVLKGWRYQNFREAFQDWLCAPTYNEMAEVSAETVLPTVLLPSIETLFAHTGWQVDEVEQVSPDGDGCDRLHDLRKHIKRVRYQLELLKPLLDQDSESLRVQLEEFAALQTLLGQMQDITVLQALLSSQLGENFAEFLPTLAQQLQTEYEQAWGLWKPLTTQYRDPAFQANCRQMLIQPSLK